ncbi:hypothetical protein [Blastopirellula marina]|uniref:Uncharacterized protein n=1 Tax=Blastopirellula marina DSM 3645 TaxID=314230 RepID=A3ZXU9_9BACT|nr:hypothetical protein [Blastopirellula marina]EAQ78653.1 hypothetical protein DSM3645_07670 [Blastopirellula marina DSM 3645]
MTEPDHNPFASPPIEDEDPADAPLIDGDRIGRWLALPMISGALNGAGVIGIVGFSLVCLFYLSVGALGEFVYSSGGRTALGAQLLQLSLFGGLFGGMSGLCHGSLAFTLRNARRQRTTIAVLGYVFPLVILGGPILYILPLQQGLPLIWKLSAGAAFCLGCLLIGWRMNGNIHKYLLSRLESESRKA